LIITGNEAVAYGAMAAGLGLYAGYPITPATKIMEVLAKDLVKMGGTVVQTEDEISAIAAVVGAFFAGKRAMTATSGPGLCLMTEMINLSVMAESPSVIVNCQRGGPSTGDIDPSWQESTNIAPEPGTEEEYLRYRFTKSGISPRAIPGTGSFFYTQTGLEHDESGKPAYTTELHRKGTEKRFLKMKGIIKEGPKPEIFGGRNADIAIMSWGSTFGVIRDMQKLAKKDGIRLAAVKVPMIYPVQNKWFERALKKFDKTLVVELNATCQLASLLQGELRGISLDKKPFISSLPLKPDEVYESIRGDLR
jgi:pyruvate/2-oxoacid:ferredoxin oxidoreductase alpha subunit